MAQLQSYHVRHRPSDDLQWRDIRSPRRKYLCWRRNYCKMGPVDSPTRSSNGLDVCLSGFASCNGKGTGWFKIDQMGMTAPPLTGTSWGTAVVYSNLAWTSTIPKNLAPGNYLIRHELLALHQANTPQFYPECAQLHVSGSGTAVPPGNYLTAIPAYATSSNPSVDVSSSCL
jgi:hypothetical protein